MLLGIVAKPLRRDKFEVTSESVAYLTGKSCFFSVSDVLFNGSLSFIALVCVSDEVRSRCHVKHSIPRWPEAPNEAMIDPPSGQNVRRQKSWDMLDQNAITYARQHKVQPHQVCLADQCWHFFHVFNQKHPYKCVLHVIFLFGFRLKPGAFILLII